MFKLFGSKSSSKNKNVASSSKDHGLKKSTNNSKESAEVMKGAQRELYKYSKPQQELGMSDLIKTHREGERFMYAAITSRDEDDNMSLIRKLAQWQPKISKKEIPIASLPKLNLYNEVETFRFTSILPKPKEGSPKTYIHLSDVMIIYGSLISTDSAFSKVKVCIIDDRLLLDKVAKQYVATTNVINKASMKLSYCFPRDEADAISLTLSCDTKFLEDDRQWGVAQVRITMVETDFPIQVSNTSVKAINAVPLGMLEEHETNPDAIDISMINNDLPDLRKFYMNGDIVDETSPIADKLEPTKYSKSTLTGPKGKKILEHVPKGWEALSNARAKGIMPKDNSIDPSEDGFDERQRELDEQFAKEVEFNVDMDEIIPALRKCDETRNEGKVLKSAMKARKVEIVAPGDISL